MNRSLLLLLAGALAAASPAGAQPQQSSRDHAHGAAGHADMDDVRAVLRTIAVHQMRYNAQHGRYASSLQELGLTQPRVIGVEITASGAEGFAAVSASSTEECVFYSGRVASPRNYAPRPNALVCRLRPVR